MDVGDLYQEFEEALHSFGVALGRDHDLADDLVQQTLIRASLNMALIQGLRPVQRRAWLFRTLKNLFIDHRRSQLRHRILLEQLARTVDLDGATPIGWSVQDLLQSVPGPDRELLEARYVRGMTSREIGEELDIPAATVRSRLRAALNRLRALESEFEK